MCVPSSEHAKMIWEVYYNRVTGHFRVEKIVAVLQKYLYWLSLRQDVGKYIWSCIAYTITKPKIKKKSLYNLHPTFSRSWESISMDYMSILSYIKHGKDCVFLVIDKFSKMAILVVWNKCIIAESTAKIFFEQVWAHFGISHSVILDQESKFLNTFWSSL